MEQKIQKLDMKSFYSKFGIAVVLVALLIICSIASPRFLTSENITNVIRQCAISGVLAIGQTFVILTGNIDLSCGALMGLSAITALSIQEQGGNMWLGILAAIIMCLIFSFFNGYCVSHGIPAFIMTLAMTEVITGVNYLISNGMPITAQVEAYEWSGQGKIGPVQVPVLVFALCFAIAYLFLKYTKMGRSIYAFGGNAESARLAGINIRLVCICAFMICGIFAAISGIVTSSRLFAANPLTGEGAEQDAIAAVVIGGTKMSGGVGSIVKTVVGVFIIGILTNILNLLGVSPYIQMISKGAIIFLAVVTDTWKRN